MEQRPRPVVAQNGSSDPKSERSYVGLEEFAMFGYGLIGTIIIIILIVWIVRKFF